MSDTWSDIQALRSRQSSLRERLHRRKKEREGLVLGITSELSTGSPRSNSPVLSTSKEESNSVPEIKADPLVEYKLLHIFLVCNIYFKCMHFKKYIF